ncbi:ShlB/FhaC/HecB family hemolysin secretion/activation protein [Allosphingosinicella sp.]|uniref:ShlB/FhaC/HecB family hemolysin secretion/activation protein n=1 Tax=Allosphingosinicella sp. TaxID=2823234 RepID=UPI003D75FD47
MAFAAAGVFPAGAIQAQTQPNIPQPPTREEIQRAPVRETTPRAPRLTVEGGIERAPCALADPQYQNIRFTVRSVAFDDLRGLAAADLSPAYAQFVGTEQPVSVICEIRDRAATILRNAGYLAAVEVPEQRIAEGNVRFQVLMAKLVGLRVRGDAGRAEQTIAGYLQRLTEQPVFNRFEAERYLLLAGDIPGYDVRLSLRSAQAGRGEVIGEVAVLRIPAEVDANIQNFGSRDLGRFGGLVRGQFYGLTGLGDRTSIALFSTADFQEQQTVQLGHDFRVGGEGLTLSGQFTYAWAEPDLDDPNLRVRARTLLATAEASYPFLRSQKETIRGALGLDLVNQRVSLNGLPITRDRLRVAFARVDMETVDQGSLNGFGGYSAAEPRWRAAGSFQARRGVDIFGASEDCGVNFARCSAVGAVPLSRLEGDPTATVFRGEVFSEYRPAPRVTFALGVRGQYGADPLLSFEEFSAGNYTVGRGYDPGSLLGDSGVGVQTEVRFGSILPTALDRPSVQPYLFFDAARVTNKDRLTSDENNKLYSAGAGLRGIYRGATIDVALAVPLKRAGVLMEEKPDPRLLISISTRLFPWSF